MIINLNLKWKYVDNQPYSFEYNFKCLKSSSNVILNFYLFKIIMEPTQFHTNKCNFLFQIFVWSWYGFLVKPLRGFKKPVK